MLDNFHNLKKVVKIASFIVVLFLLAASGLVYYFYSNIKPILVSEINKTLAVEVNVADISISGIKDFPNLGITFSDVSIDESTPYYKETLLKARELSLFVDIMKLYKGEYIIDGVTLRDGTLNVADLKNGSNYDITKPTSDTNSSAVSFEIKNLKLTRCNIRYNHTPSVYETIAYTPLSTIKLKYENNNISLRVETTLDSAMVSLEENIFVNKHNLKINTAISIDSENESVIIDPSDLLINDVKLKTKGKVLYGKKSEVDISFSNDNTTAQSLLSVLPASITKSLEQIKLDGNIEINGYFTGKTYARHNPSFGFDYKLNKTNLDIKGQDISFSGITASGNLKMPNISTLSSATAICKLQEAKSGNNKIAGDISVNNFTKPRIVWDGNADLDAVFVMAFIKDSDFKTKTGRILVDGKLGLTYDTNIGQLKKNSLSYNGTIKVNNLSGSLIEPRLDLEELNIDISGNNQKMVVNNLDFNYNKTKGSLKGYIEDYSSLLDEKSNSQLVGAMSISNLNVNELYGATSSSSKENSTSSNNLIPIKCKLKTELKNFKFNDFTAVSMTGNLISDRKSISMPNVKIKALDGNTAAAITIKKWGENHLLDINADLSAINITQLFKQFNNFEQSEITDKHLSGTLSGKIITKVILDQNYEPLLPKLYAKADVEIKNGALINYDPLKELSSFVNIKDLENVKFKTLKNTIEIFDQTIFIPKMRIENNALNLEIEGTHTFENYMKYNMGLSVAELLGKKANWIAKKAEKRIEKNAKGGLTAYITMEGTPDKLKIRYDRATVKENVKEEVKREKQNFIKAIKGEATLEEDEVDTKDYDNVWDE